MSGPRPSVKFADGWKAWRADDGRWYLNHKATERTVWMPDAGHVDATHAEMDSRWTAENPGQSPLPPPSAAAVKETERMLRVRTLRARPGVATVQQLQHVVPPAEAVFLGAGTWSHVAGGAGSLATDAAVRTALATAVAATAPVPPSPLAGVAEYTQLVSETVGSDALMQKPVLQRLGTAPAWLRTEPAAREALAEVLAAGYTGTVDSMRVLAGLLDRFHVAAPSSSSSSSSTGRGAGDGGGSDGVAGGGDVALQKVISMFVEGYSRETGDALQLSSRDGWLDEVLKVMLQSVHWRQAYLQLSHRFPHDPHVMQTIRLLARLGYHKEVFQSPVLTPFVAPYFAAALDTLAMWAHAPTAGDATGAKSRAEAVERGIAGVSSSDMGAWVVSELLLAGMQPGRSASDGSGQAMQAGGAATCDTVDPVVALRLMHVRERLRYAIAQGGHGEGGAGEWRDGSGGGGSSGGVSPAGLSLLLLPLTTCMHHAVPRVLETGEVVMDAVLAPLFADLTQLRTIAVGAFTSGLGGEMLPDERFAFTAARADLVGMPAIPGATPVTVKPGETYVPPDLSLQELVELESARRRFALCAKPISASDAGAAVAAILSLRQYLLLPAEMGHMVQLYQEGGPEGDTASIPALAHATLTLASVLSQPDVLTLLLHLLFHPNLYIKPGGASAGGGGGMAVAGDIDAAVRDVAYALGWACWCATGGQAALRTAAGALAAHFPPSQTPMADMLKRLGVEAVNPAAGASDDAAIIHWVADMPESLFACYKALKEDGVFTSLTALSEVSTSVVAAVAAAVAGSERSRHMAAMDRMADVMLHACAFQPIAVGLVHWLRHGLLQPSMFTDSRLLSTFPILARLLTALSQRHPMVSPGVHAAFRQLATMTPTLVNPADLSSMREMLLVRMADLAICGYGTPMFTYLRLTVPVWEPAIMRKVIGRFLAHLQPTMSLPAALEFARLIQASQAARIASLPPMGMLSSGEDVTRHLSVATVDEMVTLRQVLEEFSRVHLAPAAVDGAGAEVVAARTALRSVLATISANLEATKVL